MLSSDAKAVLFSLLDQSLLLRTRAHPLGPASEKLYVKREDELSAGISGSKLRKYASLVPELRRRGVTDIALVGGPNSNNLVGALQHLKGSGIRAWPFVRQAADSKLSGNALLLDMLACEDSIVTISREDWPRVESLATNALRDRGIAPDKSFVLPEGGLCFASLAGSLTLADDILRNEFETSHTFKRIYIDSGSGMTAIGLVIGLALFAADAESREVVVTLIAGTESHFESNLLQLYAAFLEQNQLPEMPLPAYRFLTPPTAKSYGSVNETVLNECRLAARTHGLLMDPVYSIKHYMAMREDLACGASERKSLFVFNGNPLGLSGFMDRLAQPTVAARENFR